MGGAELFTLRGVEVPFPAEGRENIKMKSMTIFLGLESTPTQVLDVWWE